MNVINILSKIFGNKATRDMREIQPYVELIKTAYEDIDKLDNDSLRAKTKEIQHQVQHCADDKKEEIAAIKAKIEDTPIEDREALFNKVDSLEKDILDCMEEELNKVLPEALAIMKSTARRFAEGKDVVVTANDFDRELAATHDFVDIDGDKALYHNHWTAGGNDTEWNMVHYDVQLFGGVVLHQGKIAEMATGEGKTLVATLPVFLNALTGNGVHVVTVNDYLAKRDSEWMGPLYMFNGLSVDCIDKHRPNSEERRKAYQADITFGTNNEFGFDYLRDNMAVSPEDLVQRKHNYAIVDEVDSVLIDDARTPLIISGPVPQGDDQMFEEYQPLIQSLYEVQRKYATQLLSEAKTLIESDDKKKKEEGFLQLFRAHKALPKSKALIKYLSEPGIKTGMLKTEEIYMENNNRRMPEAVEPLYFVVDEKQKSVELTDKGNDWLANAVKNSSLFVLPDIASLLSQLEGDETLSKEEKMAKKSDIMTDYSVKSERVHTILQLLKAYTMFNINEDYVLIDGKVKIVDEQTGRIMEGRRWSDGLHQAVEAKEHVKVEAATQTFATITLQNYFRMYHKLAGMTGTAITEAGEFWNIYKLDVVEIPTNRPVARKDLNDRIYKTKREKYNAVIDEIVKMRDAGRPVLVGTTSVEISELLHRMLELRKIPCQVLNAKLHQKEADIVAQAGQSSTVTIATNMAGRGTDIKLSDEVKAAGGLAIIGTERHESRRVDRQLRGRAGRQGDPGSSVFFVSLEDQLMRLFAAERISKVMDRLGLKDGEVIESPLINKSIERAQKKVEGNHFGVRKHLLEYDDVMNKQRTVVYELRSRVLNGDPESVHGLILDVMNDLVLTQAEKYLFDAKDGSLIDFMNWLGVTFPITVTEDELKPLMGNPAEAGALVMKRVEEAYEAKCAAEDPAVLPYMERGVFLQVIDREWQDFLRAMDDLRTGVNLRAYGQRDPLIEYKKEAFEMFETLMTTIKSKVVSSEFRSATAARLQAAFNRMSQAQTNRAEFDSAETAESDERTVNSEQRTDAVGSSSSSAPKTIGDVFASMMSNPRAAQAMAARTAVPAMAAAPQAASAARPVVGRNDPCPCGSGKKYKKCCGKGLV